MWQVKKSYNKAKKSKNATIKGLPISLAIEPTTACNLSCPECPSGLKQFTRPTGNLKPDFFNSLIDELSPSLYYLTLYFQGEPYINPNFLDMVAYANSKKIYTATSTNGHFLTDKNAKRTIESGLKRLIISIDGTTQETYEQYRKEGELKKVIEGAENVVKWKNKLKSKTPHLIFQFLVVKPNEHQIEEVRKLAKKIGIDEVRWKTAQFYNFEKGNSLMPENEKYSRYKKNKDGSYSLKNKYKDECWRMWSSCVITWDGLLVPCCFDKDAQHQMGDVKTENFKQIWYGEKLTAFRQAILNNRNQIEICKNCSEGAQVWN